jgi:RimJ/RimL family protein N-acetyltransferase
MELAKVTMVSGVGCPATLETARLVLRPLSSADAPEVARLAGRREIADTTLSIPHPYSLEQARAWILAHTTEAKGRELVYAIARRDTGRLIGTMGLRDIDFEHSQAELGFWIDVECWGRGYATEAARAVVRSAFENLILNRVYAHHMVRNPASGRVLEKVGMKREGLLRQRVRKWGVFEDVVVCALLRADWNGGGGAVRGASPLEG